MKKFLLPLILLLAFLLRFVSFSQYPVGFNADEASFGYDAYSILHTGRDQWGNFMPLVLKSFGDYKSPVYSYIAIPFVGLLGLTKFAVRFPNILVGVLAVLVVYLLTKEISKRYKKELSVDNPEPFALVAAFLLAVNPWHIMMSRGAFEANLVTLFIPLGIFFFLKATDSTRYTIYYILSSLAFGISLYTYHSAQLISPLIGAGLLVIFWKKLKSISLKRLLPALFILIVLLVGIAYTFDVGGGARVSERSITQGALEEGASAKIELVQNGTNPLIAKILHNKYQVIFQRFTSNYIQYFSSRFLFTNGAGEATYGMVPGIGVLYIFDGLLLLGLIPLIIQKKAAKIVSAFIFWLLIAALPAALSTGVGFAGNRAEGMLPAVQMLEAFGLIGWIMIVKRFNKKLIYITAAFLSVLIFLEIKNFCKLYFTTQTETVEKGMLVGDLEVAQWLKVNANENRVIVSRTLSEPQIFIAFAGPINPVEFQKSTQSWGFDESGQEWIDQLPEYGLGGSYTFKSLDWTVDGADGATIIVGSNSEFQKNLIPLKIFNYSGGNMAIFVTRNIKSI
jgi:4-amino-4-deoxy-L-arabinose transferase-like glycosyltransferase